MFVSRIIFSSEEDARKVLNLMKKFIDEKSFCSVNDYYIFSRENGAINRDRLEGSLRYGWMSLRNARIKKVGKYLTGYIIDLPTPIEKW